MGFKDVFRKQPNQAEREAYEFAGIVMEANEISEDQGRIPSPLEGTAYLYAKETRTAYERTQWNVMAENYENMLLFVTADNGESDSDS